MNESSFTSRLLAALRGDPILRDGIVWKLSDRFTGGIPDFLVAVRGRVTFWEVKVNPRKLTKLQAYYINRLFPIAYVIRTDGKQQHWISGDNDAYSFAELVREVTIRCVSQQPPPKGDGLFVRTSNASVD